MMHSKVYMGNFLELDYFFVVVNLSIYEERGFDNPEFHRDDYSIIKNDYTHESKSDSPNSFGKTH